MGVGTLSHFVLPAVLAVTSGCFLGYVDSKRAEPYDRIESQLWSEFHRTCLFVGRYSHQGPCAPMITRRPDLSRSSGLPEFAHQEGIFDVWLDGALFRFECMPAMRGPAHTLVCKRLAMPVSMASALPSASSTPAPSASASTEASKEFL
jgi:hypothetical protein